MAASESCGHRSSSLANNTSSHRQALLYRRSEPKPIVSPAGPRTSSGSSTRRTRNSSSSSNNNSPSTIGADANQATTKRLEPLGIEEYEKKYRLGSTDLELIERVFLGSFENNQLRAALWPYLFGLIVHRGRFEKLNNYRPAVDTALGQSSPATTTTAKKVIQPDSSQTNTTEYVFIEHEANTKRWLELEQMYLSYEAQWKAITCDQEERFTLFRERKALIGRDVIRCDRLHPFYAEQPKNLDLLSSLLMTYMMFDFDIGYVQGMSDLAGPILYIFDGDLVKSFWVFVQVMKLVRRNFEHTQKSIHFQLSCLFGLIRITDPEFAKYLEDQESSNCFFAFRAILCQFKRELMKDDAGYYDKCLQLWDTIWCVERRCVLEANLIVAINQGDVARSSSSPRSFSNHNHHHHHHHHYHGASWTNIPHYLTSPPRPLARSPQVNGCSSSSSGSGSNNSSSNSNSNNNNTKWPLPAARDQNQPDTPRHNLTETEMFILALCFVMIWRERDNILSNRLDGNDIHLHFIEPKLSKDLNGFIQNAINTYRIMKNGLDLTLLTSARTSSSSLEYGDGYDANANNHSGIGKQPAPLAATLAPLINFRTSSMTATSNSPTTSSCLNPLEEFHLGSPGSLEGYDFLNDFLIINRVPGR